MDSNEMTESSSPRPKHITAATGFFPRSALGWLATAGLVLKTLTGALNGAESLDLSRAVVVVGATAPGPEQKAAQMLVEEVARRTELHWSRTNAVIDSGPTILIGTLAELRAMAGPDKLSLPAAVGRGRAEGFSIWSVGSPAARRIIVAGHDSRGVLFGVGRLLRQLALNRRKATLDLDFKIDTAPQMPLRGHQLGYRPKTNSYDAWDVPTWEQYIRDLVIFGCNAIELIPPRSDDDPDSSHFPLPQMQMMIEMSRLAAAYALDVWIWYPAMDKDYSDAATVEFALREWSEVFRQLPRVDAVFVPGGDPGHTQPRYLLALLQKQTENLRRFHPKAAMWVSPQSFTKAWMDEFLGLLKAEPAWLAGIAYGPQVRMPLAELRAAVPKRYPIRDYPDITHSRHCQYPVPEWDTAFALTEGREVINPRPVQMAQIFRATTLWDAIGFITYSEGCNDDVNKAVWSALGWDPQADVRKVLREYARCFIGTQQERDFADGLFALEQNWNGAIVTNSAIELTLEKFRALERQAGPSEKSNWRWQQAVFRAYYDAYVRRRATNEAALEYQALRALATEADSESRMKSAEEILVAPVSTAPDLRARLFELGEALYQSIRMQLSVERYAGMRGRGNSLDDIDVPLNDAEWLRHRFLQIRGLPDEAARQTALAEILRRTDPGPGGFYDDLGDPGRQPHLLPGLGWRKDPGFFATPQIGFNDRVNEGQPLPRASWTSAESLYTATIQMRYRDLDPAARYKIRVVYGRYKNSGKIRLVATERAGSHEVHGWLKKECEPLEFNIPPAATADGELTLTWQPEPDRGGNGRVMEVAEVWLMRK
ncbi:MAG TPA: hypothetical protein VJS65_13145 [Verrucomicrobiae bacterium]|nr:hypothetical protein [Verrucomicrobiae bacterium]